MLERSNQHQEDSMLNIELACQRFERIKVNHIGQQIPLYLLPRLNRLNHDIKESNNYLCNISDEENNR